MEIGDAMTFLKNFSAQMFYVGFMKSAEAWFPLAMVGSPEVRSDALDTLCVSRSYDAMSEMVAAYAREIPQVEQTFVQFLLTDEIANLLERYGLENVALISAATNEGGSGCGCS